MYTHWLEETVKNKIDYTHKRAHTHLLCYIYIHILVVNFSSARKFFIFSLSLSPLRSIFISLNLVVHNAFNAFDSSGSNAGKKAFSFFPFSLEMSHNNNNKIYFRYCAFAHLRVFLFSFFYSINWESNSLCLITRRSKKTVQKKQNNSKSKKKKETYTNR